MALVLFPTFPRRALACALLLGASLASLAQTADKRNLVVGTVGPAFSAKQVVSASGFNEKRVALVIGNSAYTNSPLRNPVNDAADMATRLRSLGFDVVQRNNLTIRQIGGTLREFRSKLSPGAVALVFYAGHGLQIKGENYLPTVDADINSEEDVPNQSISMRQLMDVLDEAKTRLNLVFLDACRNNPYARSFRSSDQGLARISAPSGTLISYATRPGSVAADGTGRNGLYTGELLRQMQKAQAPIEQVLKRVVSSVKSGSHGKQEPWMEGSIEGDFCFGGCGQGEQTAAVAAAPGAPGASPRPAQDADTQLWTEVKSSGARDYYDAYLQQFPKGKYVALARLELQKLSEAEKAERAREEVRQARAAPSEQLPRQNEEAARGTGEAPAVKAFRECADCPEVVILPTGSFEMGSNADSGDEKPVRRVLVNSFAMGTTEVTQAQWQEVMGSNPSYFKNCGAACPVERVSWNDVQTFIQRLNAKTGKNYRLPSEAEWEYACRAGAHQEYCGSDRVDAVAWYGANSGSSTHPVKTKQANAWGLYDMSGNVREWTLDCANKSYQGAPLDGSAWESGDCSRRMLRGGSWNSKSQSPRASNRHKSALEDRNIFFGLRLARTLP